MLFLLLIGINCSLSSTGLGHTLLKFVYTAGCINEFLRTSIKRMASVANTYHDIFASGVSLEGIPTSAANFSLFLFRMNLLFHNMKLPLFGGENLF